MLENEENKMNTENNESENILVKKYSFAFKVQILKSDT